MKNSKNQIKNALVLDGKVFIIDRANNAEKVCGTCAIRKRCKPEYVCVCDLVQPNSGMDEHFVEVKNVKLVSNEKS